MRLHATMTIAVLCLMLLFSGRLAAAEKSFGGGGGGYGGETSGGESAAAAAEPPPEKAYMIPKEEQATPSSSESTTPSSDSSSSTPSGGGGGYGLDPAGEPENGMNQKAIDDILKEHNLFRAKEHVPPLAWNETLAKFSQQYAETLKGPCKPVHSTSPYGENLMFGTGGITWKTTVDEWSNEKKSYHYGSNTCDPGKMCGHYTAVVWKDTTTVGCGRVKCNNGDTMIMCSYWPPGNYDGVKPF
ncbi:pathogenesis-related protein PRB1-3-like [Panicum miliaceum]|uniref:Pathogenesis-related protein PRB1-3-like n=1 Tax=Panicum miliaceum TaxID=4540 RepID=A0A3L6SU04_PANMI|nr:pathogenesis-related protein PRB1-3-like [Panicum miliaceum]